MITNHAMASLCPRSPPCGRTLYGPFTWVHTGQNTELNQGNSTGWAAVWLRTNASSIVSEFATGSAEQSTAQVFAQVELLDPQFRVAQVVRCRTDHAEGSLRLVVVCVLPSLRLKTAAGAYEHHVGLRFRGPRGTPDKGGVALLTTTFA